MLVGLAPAASRSQVKHLTTEPLRSLWTGLICVQTFLKSKPGLYLRLLNEKIFFLFLNQNICRGYSKEPSQRAPKTYAKSYR